MLPPCQITTPPMLPPPTVQVVRYWWCGRPGCTGMQAGTRLHHNDHFFRDVVLFFGTFAPDRRACDSPIAIACLRLLTFLPERPLFSVPRFRSRIAFSTFFEAFLPYFAMASPLSYRSC